MTKTYARSGKHTKAFLSVRKTAHGYAFTEEGVYLTEVVAYILQYI